jgi:Leucine-rich repeat (LRR) protein
MVRIFITLLLLLVLLSNSAQEVKKTPAYSIDPAYKARLLKLEREAVEKRKLLLKEWENANTDSVYKVNFRSLYFKEMPDISRFKNLEVIEGGSNKITVLPKSTFASDSLTRVVFSYNEIERVKFRSNTKIRSVNLSNNKLKRIPRSVRKLKQLRELDLSGNKI